MDEETALNTQFNESGDKPAVNNPDVNVDDDADYDTEEASGIDEDDDVDDDVDDDDDDVDDDDDSDTEPGIVMNTSIVKEVSEEEDSVDEDEDEDDDDYLKKFDTDVVSNYIDIYHPESRMHNYDEVRAMSCVIKDETGTIIDDLHKTIPFLTKFEKAKILGLRAKQINDGAQPFVKVPVDVINGYTIAQLELSEKKIPFIIRRPIPNGGSEYWKLSELENII
jgi:DNA-directed RNA polymerase subunit K/omega